MGYSTETIRDNDGVGNVQGVDTGKKLGEEHANKVNKKGGSIIIQCPRGCQMT